MISHLELSKATDFSFVFHLLKIFPPSLRTWNVSILRKEMMMHLMRLCIPSLSDYYFLKIFFMKLFIWSKDTGGFPREIEGLIMLPLAIYFYIWLKYTSYHQDFCQVKSSQVQILSPKSKFQFKVPIQSLKS